MSILSNITSFTARFRADMSQPRERYIHLDGSMYGVPLWKRLVTTPCIQSGVIIAALTAAADGLIALKTGATPLFKRMLLVELGVLPFAQWLYWSHFTAAMPVSKDAVIDKTGRLPTDPSASTTMEQFYKRTARTDFKLGFLMGAISCAI